MIDIILKYLPAFLGGLKTTLVLAGFAWTLGMTGGVLLSAIFPYRNPILGNVGRAISFAISSIPLLVLLFWFHFPLQEMLGVVVEPFFTALLVLVLINALSVYGIIAPAVAQFPRQYEWAAQVSGLSRQEFVRHIQLPIIIRRTAPSIINIQVLILQSTVFASIISVDELFRVAQRINSIVLKPIEIYTAMTAFYFLASAPLLLLSSHLRRRFARDESER